MKHIAKKAKVAINVVLVYALFGCVERSNTIAQDNQNAHEAVPTIEAKNTGKKKDSKNSAKSNKVDSLKDKSDNASSRVEQSSAKDNFENIKGEQNKEVVQEDGRTYDAVITYKPGTKIKHGKETLYYLDGKIAQQSFYIDGKRDGLYQIFSQKGVLIYEAYYRNGELHGLCKIFDVASGRIKSEMNFAHGVLDGEMKIYNTDGLLWYSFTYKHGQKDGVAKEFDEQAKIIRETLYKDDMEIKR